jgi:hypothetical protein
VRRMSENVKVEDLRPGDIVRDQEGGTGEVDRGCGHYSGSVHTIYYREGATLSAITPALGLGVDYAAGRVVERVNGGEDA